MRRFPDEEHHLAEDRGKKIGMVLTIDLNADIGESPERLADGSDAELMRYITSANIACGGHAGSVAFSVSGTARRAIWAGRPAHLVETARRVWLRRATRLVFD